MAKKQKTVSAAPPGSAPETNVASPVGAANSAQKWSLLDFRIQAAIIAILGLIFYINSFSNEYALDDRPIVVQNDYVRQGFAGIPKILTSDAFESYFIHQNSANSLTGGRFRPLSIVTFAIEQQILGIPEPDTRDEKTKLNEGNLESPAQIAKTNSDMHVRHAVNVLLYIFSIIVLLNFLRKFVFPDNQIIPFVACLLFIIHPIHSEVVANVKSRDEILSLMFITLTLGYALTYHAGRKQNDLIKALVCYLLALLSKEYALAMVLLLPLSLYVFKKESIDGSFKAFLPFLIPLALYGLLRYAAEAHANGEAAPDDIQNIPYLFATGSQKIASIVAILLKYFMLLLFPYPLSCDYSYKQLAYRELNDPVFWVALAFYGAVVLGFLKLLQQRHVLAFAFAFYLFHLALVGNVFVNVGAPMGERLVYHSSVGFVIVLAWGLYYIFSKLPSPKVGMAAMGVLIAVIAIFSGFTTITRNAVWKNDRTLYLHDVTVSPNSLLILGNAGSASIDLADAEKDSVKKKELYRQAISFFDKAVTIHPKFANGYENRGVAYYKLGFTDLAVADWDSTRKYHPGHPELPYVMGIASNYYYRDGLKYGKGGQHELAIKAFTKSAHCKPTEPDIWYNLGYANMMGGHYQAAINAFQNSLRLQSRNAHVREYMEKCAGLLAQEQGAPHP